MATKGSRRRRVSTPLDQQLIGLAPGLALAPVQQALIADDELHIEVAIDVDYDTDTGRLEPVCFAITRLPGAPRMTEVLRRLAPTTLIEEALRDAVETAILAEVTPGRWELAGTQRLTDEDESVYIARLYRVGALCGYRPTQFVRAILGVAASTAAQKVGLARKLGLLPKTTPGKAKV
jgi:hypothetical protein